jgi:hypothetical protein
LAGVGCIFGGQNSEYKIEMLGRGGVPGTKSRYLGITFCERKTNCRLEPPTMVNGPEKDFGEQL